MRPYHAVSPPNSTCKITSPNSQRTEIIPTSHQQVQGTHFSAHVQKKDLKNTAAPAVSVFSVIEFSPQGLTTKNYMFINNFWPFPGFFYNSVGDFCLFLSFIIIASVFWVNPAKFPQNLSRRLNYRKNIIIGKKKVNASNLFFFRQLRYFSVLFCIHNSAGSCISKIAKYERQL